LRVGDLGRQEFTNTLAEDGIALTTGPFSVRVRSGLPEIADTVRLLYGDVALSHAAVMDFHFNIRPAGGIARRLARHVNCFIDDDPILYPYPRSQAVALFEWGLNGCILRFGHRFMLSHAAVLERDGRAIIIPGTSGAGKSTLTAALAVSGWRLFSDELALIRLDDGLLYPLARPIALKNDSIDIIRQFAPEAVFGPPVHGTQKGTIAHMKAPGEAVARAAEPAPARAILFVTYTPGAEPEVTPVTKGQAFYEIARGTINYAVFGAAGFQALADLVESCDCLGFRYSRLDDAVRAFDDLF